MAKIKGPLFSIAAHGSIGKALTYSTIGAKTRARYQKKQRVHSSYALLQQRAKFAMANMFWDSLTPEEKEEWKDLVHQR